MVAQNEIRFVGVDGCSYGWFSVGFSQNGHYETNAFRTFQELLAHYANADLILVDMPIGLPDGPEERRCDVQARTRLNRNGARRGSTVFRAPTRTAVEYLAQDLQYNGVFAVIQQALAGVIQQELQVAVRPATVTAVWNQLITRVHREFTKALQLEITGTSLSQQTLGIIAKIAELDALLPNNGNPLVREVHPEICFWALTGGNTIVPSKTTQAGKQARIAALNNVGVQAQEILTNASVAYPGRMVAEDDILDALVAAVTAREGYRHGFQQVPGSGGIDGNGLTMEMVYWMP